MLILAVDIGTTGMKMGVFELVDDIPELRVQFSQPYAINVYEDGLFADIEQSKWQQAFRAGCTAMADAITSVQVITLSGTTPGLTVMDDQGEALYPAILMLDQRSRQQAGRIIDSVGMQELLESTGNVPVAGGCSLASLLWLKETHPDLFGRIEKFGHSNTFMAKWLTGNYAMDPSSASLTALYNTVRNDLTWNTGIMSAMGLKTDIAPPLLPSHRSVGKLQPELARSLGFKTRPDVLIGGNDAVLAAYSLGIEQPGEIINVNGTCEITLVCLPECLSSGNYNVRAHVVPDRWLTLYVMNAGGVAIEWFRNMFCSEMDAPTFFDQFMPQAVQQWLTRPSGISYLPYLMGSRYSMEPLKAEFRGLTQTSTREELFAALLRGLCQYQKAHLDEIEKQLSLDKTIHITGGAASPCVIEAKKQWMRNCNYIYEDQSSMKGAAMLTTLYLAEQD